MPFFIFGLLPITIFMAKPKVVEAKINELIPDNLNANKGTEYGKHLMEKSFRELGAGRSILVDKNNRIIGGNKSAEQCAEIGLEDVIIVETDGTKLVAVKRTDIDIDSEQGRNLALADNATSKANLAWDEENLKVIKENWGVDAQDWGVKDFESVNVNPEELGTEFSLKSGDKEPFQQMTFTLADDQAEVIKNAMTEIKQTEEYKYCETFGNENSNGNALYLIVQQWAEQRK